MRPTRCSVLWTMALVLVGCDPKETGPTSDDYARVVDQLDITDTRLAALEAKLAALDEPLTKIAAWAEAQPTEPVLSEAERQAAELAAQLEQLEAERDARPLELSVGEDGVDWLDCEVEEEARVACETSRAELDELLSNPAAMAKWARIVPSQKDGRTQGYKVYGVRRGSPLRAAGLKNGDLITSIAGESMTSIDAAMSAYTKFRSSNSIRFEILRHGKLWTLELTVVE